MARGDNYITEVRRLNAQVWEGINGLVAMQREWNAADYGTTLAAGSGGNEGIASADVGAVVFATSDALVAVLNAGSATNMAKLL